MSYTYERDSTCQIVMPIEEFDKLLGDIKKNLLGGRADSAKLEMVTTFVMNRTVAIRWVLPTEKGEVR